MNADPKLINVFQMKSNGHVPSITLEGEYLFKTNFFPGRLMVAEIYDDQIVIKPLVADESMKFRI